MSAELTADDLEAISKFIRAVSDASRETGVDIHDEYLWMDGEIVGRIEPNGGGYSFKACA